MLKNKKTILLVLLLLASGYQVIRSQDLTYSQFYANPLYLNPALAGAESCPRVFLNYRNQWPSLPGAFASYAASFDGYSDFLHGGYGVQVDYNKAGEAAISKMMASAIYAYRLNVSSEMTAHLAVQAGYGQRSLRWDELVFASGIDPGTGDPLPPGPPPQDFTGDVSYLDFATGMLIGYQDKYFFGAAVHHLSQPDISFMGSSEYPLNMKITVHGGANIGGEGRSRRSYSPSLMISPNFLYQQQGEYRHLNLGSYFTFEPFVAGIWYHHAFENPDAMIISLGISQEQYRIGYSYDYTLSGLSNATGGAHEISLVWIFDCDKKRKRSRAIKCPTF